LLATHIRQIKIRAEKCRKQIEVYRNSGLAGICISVPVPAGTGAIPDEIYKSSKEVFDVII